MFWIGRLNAVLALVGFTGLVLIFLNAGVTSALGWLLFMSLVRIAFSILNTVWTAVSGNPLFYDIKDLRRRDE